VRVHITEDATSGQVAGGLQVFTDFWRILEESGYRKIRVDTWVGPKHLMSVRGGYAGGEWRLHIENGTDKPFTVKFDIHHVLPTVEQLLEATVLRETPPGDHELDARREMTIRGEE
jgi:hypothetical protein